MTSAADEFRNYLIKLDVAGIRGLWAKIAPHLHQPKDDAEALATLHVARTGAESIPHRHRFYSHQWCTERGFPSKLPDALKPQAERMYPRAVGAVGISVNFPPLLKTVGLAVRGAMSDAVEEVYADGRGDDIPLVRKRMAEARVRELRGFGL